MSKFKFQNYRAVSLPLSSNSIKNGSTTPSLETIASQLQSANPEDKVHACNSIAHVASQDEPRSQIVQQNIVQLISPLLIEKDFVVVGSSLQCLYELSCQSEDMVHHLVSLDVMTPLFSFISRFGAEKVTEETILVNSLNLLWNLLQEDDVIDVFNSSQIIHHLIPLLSPTFSTSVRVSCLSLLETGCEGNPPAQEAIAPHMNNIANLVSSADEDNLIRISATLLIVTASADKQMITNNQSLSLIFQSVTEMLELKSSSTIAEVVKTFEKQQVESFIHWIKVKITAVEVLIYIASLNDADNIDQSEGDGSDEEAMEDEETMEETDMEEVKEDKISSDLELFTDFLASTSMLHKVFANTTNLLPKEIKTQLMENEMGQVLCTLYETMVFDSYDCISKVTKIMTTSQLGAVENVKNVWMNLCRNLCSKPDNLELAEGLSRAVRTLTEKACLEESGVLDKILENVGTNDLEKLVAVYSEYSTEESSKIRANLVNILGNFGCIATKNMLDPDCVIIVTTLANWILEVVMQDTSLRVALEGIDKLMDVFMWDYTDGLLAELDLMNTLKQLSSQLLKTRIKKEKKSLDKDDLVLASTVPHSLKNFIEEKEQKLKTNIS